MKKILILLFLLTILLNGCDAVDKADANLISNNMFVDVTSLSGMVINYFDFHVVYHKDTKVMYAVSRNGEITVLVDANGKPMLYEGKELGE